MQPSPMPSPSSPPLTAEQFEELACHLDNAELWDGHLLLREPAGWPASPVGGLLLGLVGHHLVERGRGMLCDSSAGFLLRRTPDRVLAPDLAVIADPDAQRFPPRGFPEVVPDLVAEVRSPRDSWEYVLSRGGVWLAHGVQVVWCIDPLGRRAVEYRPDTPPVLLSDAPDAVLRAAPVLPDLEIPFVRLLRGTV